ncbi:MAG: hypothetical protein DMF56_19635 [Acidobacteria bacterium]|nr:MAG: hypothetical protein DMF56_19635 [Acidobacteriota bacterium]
MPFPDHIESILTAYGVRPDTKAALYDLYVALGDEVLEVFGDIAERATSVTDLRPEDTHAIRAAVVERYLRRCHPRWLASTPTPSLWHPRAAEGRASGAAVPLDPEHSHGMLILGRNAHSGGRSETISFDLVARDVEDAVAIARAEGQQHTLPGSVGETSGTFDSVHGVALIWEVQPNVYKPAGERNRAIAKLYRRHRDWHRLTLTAALEWLRGQQKCATYILRGNALSIVHEMNPAKPVSETIASLHNRTVEEVARTMNVSLLDPTDVDELMLLDSIVMNHALRKHVLQHGAAGLLWKAEFTAYP